MNDDALRCVCGHIVHGNIGGCGSCQSYGCQCDQLRLASEYERCSGGWPGGVHRLEERGVDCPVCGGSGWKKIGQTFAH